MTPNFLSLVRRGTALAVLDLVGLGLGNTLGEDLGVLRLKRRSVKSRRGAEQGGEKRTASSLTFSAWRRLSAILWRLCWRRWGVTRRWILGALV